MLARTAAVLSRLYLPSPARAITGSRATGQIRAAGKWFFAFYAAACIGWLSSAAFLCSWIAGVTANRTPAAFAEWCAGWYPAFVAAFLPLVKFTSVVPTGIVVFATLVAFAAVTLAQKRWKLDVDDHDPAAPSRLTLLGQFLLAPFWGTLLMAVTGVKVGFAAVLAFGVLSLAFPGLFEGSDPVARVHWGVWLALAAALTAYRQASSLNPRIREFAGLPSVRGASHTWLSSMVQWLRSGEVTSVGQYTLAKLENEREALANLERVIAFYVREGLDHLYDVGNPERRYYTAAQRQLLHRAYGALQLAAAKRKQWIEWYEGDLEKMAGAHPALSTDSPGAVPSNATSC